MFFAASTTTAYGASKTIFVDAVNGDDSNGGLNPGDAFRAVETAVAAASAGDIVQLLPGVYRQGITINGASGEAGSPILVRGQPDRTAVIDGTVDIDTIADGPWTLHRDGIYKRRLTQEIWQLFLDDKLLEVGRWPNATLVNGTIWSRDDAMRPWSYGTNGSSPTATFSALTGFPEGNRADFLKGVAILNYYNWLTRANGLVSVDWNTGTVVLDGAPFETYGSKAGYFLGLGCIDSDSEWWFDHTSQTLYMQGLGGGDPSTLVGTLKGRVRDYGITFASCSHIRVEELDFFSAGLAIRSGSSHVSIDSCRFRYPNTSKFMLGIYGMPHNKFYRDPSTNNVCFIIEAADCELINSHVEFPNTGIVLSGSDMRVENNTFHDIEWDTVSNAGSGSIMLGSRMKFLRNRVYLGGNSEGVRPLSGENDIEIAYNHLSNLSLLQVDGAAINCSLYCLRNHVHHNWIHDSNRAAIRWDWWPDPAAGGDPRVHGGCWHHNVTWNAPIWQIKNDHNVVFNNIGTKSASVYFYDYAGGYNTNSIAVNNLTELGLKSAYLLRDNLVQNGVEFDLLVDWQQFDFRPSDATGPLTDQGSDLLLSEIRGLAEHGIPVPQNGDKVDIFTVGNSPDIGAYEYGADEYWIPGPKGDKASWPIPAAGAIKQPISRDMMFLIGRGGIGARIYLGTNSSDLPLIAAKADPKNVVRAGIDYELLPDRTYYWRVDTVTATGIVAGDVWGFTTATSGDTTPPIREFDFVRDDFDDGNVAVNINGLGSGFAKAVASGANPDLFAESATASAIVFGDQTGTWAKRAANCNDEIAFTAYPKMRFTWEIDNLVPVNGTDATDVQLFFGVWSDDLAQTEGGGPWEHNQGGFWVQMNLQADNPTDSQFQLSGNMGVVDNSNVASSSASHVSLGSLGAHTLDDGVDDIIVVMTLDMIGGGSEQFKYELSVSAGGTPLRTLSGTTDAGLIGTDLLAEELAGGVWAGFHVGNRATGRATVDLERIRIEYIANSPWISNINGDVVIFAAGRSSAALIDQGVDAVVSDPNNDRPDFDTETLTVSITAGGFPAEDVLGINNEGPNTGQIGVSGTAITFGGTVVGSVSGGYGGSDLVVTLNGDASLAGISALVRHITYANSYGGEATEGDRTVAFSISDPKGESAGTATATVKVRAAPTSPFDAYMTAAGLPGAQPGDDFDWDGDSNFQEFAHGTRPDSPASGVDAFVSARIEPDSATFEDHFTFTLPIRKGAVFAGSPLVATVDGIQYTIEGSRDLETYAASVEELSPALRENSDLDDPTTYSYRTFRLTDSIQTLPKGFLRARVNAVAP